MNRKPLLFPAPVERLTRQIQLLPPSIRTPAWRLYAMLRRRARRETLATDLDTTTEQLAQSVFHGLPFRIVTLAVKLAQTYTQQELSARGAAHRARRAHAQESFFLLRRRLRHALGHRELAPDPSWSLNAQQAVAPWRAICDGSFKAAVSSAAAIVYDEQGQVRAEVCVSVPARSAVDVELQACAHALQTLLLFGCRDAVVDVDSQAVLTGLRQGLPLRYCLLEAELRQLTEQFDSLCVRLAPRVSTYPADRMAAQVSRH